MHNKTWDIFYEDYKTESDMNVIGEVHSDLWGGDLGREGFQDPYPLSCWGGTVLSEMGPPPCAVVGEGRDTRSGKGKQGPGGHNKGSEWWSQYNEKHEKG